MHDFMPILTKSIHERNGFGVTRGYSLVLTSQGSWVFGFVFLGFSSLLPMRRAG